MPSKKQRSGVSKKPAKAVKKAAGPKRLEAVKPALPKKSTAPSKATAKGPTTKDVAPKDAPKDATRATVVPQAAALPKPPASPKKGRRPDVDTLKTLPTEELWTFYRKAVRVKPVDAEWIETLRNVLMELHYPLVKHIAERLLQTLPKSLELDDLVSAGLFGLMDAIRGFDPDRGIKFKTYCTTRIRGSILDELRSQDWVPRLVRLKAHRLDRAIRQLEGELGRAHNHAEIAQALGITMEELQAHEAEANAKTIFSLSEKWDDGDEEKEMEKVEILADRKSVDPVDTIQQRDALEMITGSLTKKERLIILMYYYEGLTMREIGEIMELTESRVCQIHSNVMARLKAQLDRSANQLV